MLDTVAISALGDGKQDFLRQFPLLFALYLPSIVLGEYCEGLMVSRRREWCEAWLEDLEQTSTILHVTSQTARQYAMTLHTMKRMGKIIPTNDLWIAALALEHQLPVVRRDRHFDLVPGVRRLEW